MNGATNHDGEGQGVTRRHDAYGLTIVTGHRFSFNVTERPAPGAPELRFDVVTEPLLPSGWDAAAPLFTSGSARPDLPADMEAFDLGAVKVLRFLGAADFHLLIDDDRIVCHLRDERYRFAVDIWLMGTVLALWLELKGAPVLHASAVAVSGSCLGFLATSKGGKSSLAAAMVRRGNPLLSDDNLALRRGEDGSWLGVPSYAQMRMWPDQAERLLGSTAGLERVQPSSEKLRVPVGDGGFGSFRRKPAAVGALYLPERQAGAQSVTRERVPLAEALVELVRNTFLFEVVERFGLAARRFSAFGDLLKTVPVYRLRYPEGLQLLDAVGAELELFSVGDGGGYRGDQTKTSNLRSS